MQSKRKSIWLPKQLEKRRKGFFWKWECLRKNEEFRPACLRLLAFLELHGLNDIYQREEWPQSLPEEVYGEIATMEITWAFPFFKDCEEELTSSEIEMLAESNWPPKNEDFRTLASRKEIFDFSKGQYEFYKNSKFDTPGSSHVVFVVPTN